MFRPVQRTLPPLPLPLGGLLSCHVTALLTLHNHAFNVSVFPNEGLFALSILWLQAMAVFTFTNGSKIWI